MIHWVCEVIHRMYSEARDLNNCILYRSSKVAFLREFVQNIKGPDENEILSKIGFDTDARRI